MGRRILAQLALVVAATHHLPGHHDHRADRHVVVAERLARLLHREAHEVLVARRAHGFKRTAHPPMTWTGGRATSDPPPCLPVSMLRRALLTACAVLAASAPAASAAPHVRGEVLVRYAAGTVPAARNAAARAAGLVRPHAVGARTEILH